MRLFTHSPVRQFVPGSQIDWAHPHAAHLFRAIVCNGSVGALDLVGGASTSEQSAGNVNLNPRIPTRFGPAFYGATGQRGIDTFFPSPLLGQTRATTALIVHFLEQENLPHLYREFPNSNPRLIVFLSNANIIFRIFGNGFNDVSAAHNFVAGHSYVLMYTFDRPASRFKAYIDGRLAGTATSTPGEASYPSTEDSETPKIIPNTSTIVSKNAVAGVFTWRDRVFSEDEARTFAANPLDLLRAPSFHKNIYIPAGQNYEEPVSLDLDLAQAASAARGLPASIVLAAGYTAAAAAHLDAAAPIALGLDLDAALSARADLAGAIALDLDLEVSAVGAGAVIESVGLGLSLEANAAATVQHQAAVTLGLEVDDGIRGGHLFGEAIALDLEWDQLAVMGFLYAEAAAIAMEFDVALATRMAASGTILLACSLACAQSSSSAYVASVALGLVLDYVPVSKIDAVDAITLDLELNAHAAVAHAFADAIALALEMDATAAARLGAVGIAVLTFALEAEASAKLDAVASVSLGVELDQGHATKLDAVEAVALGAAFDLDLAGSGRGFSNAVALGVQVALAAQAVRAGNDPGAFRPEPGGTPGIFRPPGSGATPGMLRPAGGGVRPDIFKREGS